MTLIEIFDLDIADRDLLTETDSFLTEIPPAETESIRGGRIATAVPISRIEASFNIDSGDDTADSGTLRIDRTPGNRNGISFRVGGKILDRVDNFFYTDSGKAPLGGTPIPDFPGAYTF
jgi:hypothetical protein